VLSVDGMEVHRLRLSLIRKEGRRSPQQAGLTGASLSILTASGIFTGVSEDSQQADGAR